MFTAQHDVRPRSGFGDAARIGGAENDLDVRGMAGDPGRGDSDRCDAVLVSQLVDQVVEIGISLAIAEEDPVEVTLQEWRPRLQGDTRSA